MLRRIYFSALLLFCVTQSTVEASTYKHPEWYALHRLHRAQKVAKGLDALPLSGFMQKWKFEYLADFPFLEVYTEVSRVLGQAIEAARINAKMNPMNAADFLLTIDAATFTLSNIATEDQLGELERLYDSASEILNEEPLESGEHIRKIWAAARLRISDRKGPLPSLAKNILRVQRGKPVEAFPESLHGERAVTLKGFMETASQPPDTEEDTSVPPETAHSFAERLRKHLEANIVEQPEVIDGLVKMMVQRKLKAGTETGADAVVLAGLPGNGKDLITRTLVDAIHGRKGAWRRELCQLKVLTSEKDAWGILGSATGYIGSTRLTPLLAYLVRYSGGRYKVLSRNVGGSAEEYIVENPEWRPGRVLPGYEPPWKGVIFVNEFHNWSKRAKDVVLKEALEYGIFKLNNTSGGVEYLEVPVNFVVASNDGIQLIAARDRDGTRIGRPLPYPRLLANWERHRHQRSVIRQQMISPDSQRGTADSETSRGTSEEVVNRLPESRIFLLKPISPKGLQRVVGAKLDDMRSVYQDSSEGGLRNLRLKFTDNLISFLQTYHYIPEDNARPMEDRVEALVENTFIDAFLKGRLKESEELQHFTLDIEQNDDGTSDLIFIKTDQAGVELSRFREHIEATEEDRKREPISDERIDKLLAIPTALADRVVGGGPVLTRLSEGVLIADEQKHGRDDPDFPTRPATVFAILGPSSVGKTHTVKSAVEVIAENLDNLKVFEMSQATSVSAMEEMFFGRKDPITNATIKSTFMNHYDKWGGDVWILLDEVSDTNAQLLRLLLPILREPSVTFADGKPRPMGNVKIIMAGNASEEWYNDIPNNIPWIERQMAMESVYQQAMGDLDFQRTFLEKFFAKAFATRVGNDRTFFFGPLTFRDIRDLAQRKIVQAIQNLRPKEGRRGWDVRFKDQETYLSFLEDIETQAYMIQEQGESLNRFARENFENRLRFELLKAKVPSESRIVLERSGSRVDPITQRTILIYHAHYQRGKPPLVLEMTGRIPEVLPKRRPEDQVLVNLHEAAHEVARRVLFAEKYQAKRLTTIPGVKNIDSRWLRYLGYAESRRVQEMQLTKAVMINEMAVLAAGEVGQALATQGEVTDAGKSNDMQRATRLAHFAILQGGLSDVWGETIPQGVEPKDYLLGLSEGRRRVFEAEVQTWLLQAKALARATIKKHFKTTVLPLGLKLAEVADMNERAIEDFYQTQSQLEKPTLEEVRAELEFLGQRTEDMAQLLEVSPRLIEGIRIPDQMADPYEIALQYRRFQIETVAVSRDIQFSPVYESGPLAPLSPAGCPGALAQLPAEKTEKP